MFEPSDTPRVFGLPPGVDFCAALLDGLRDRLGQQPPEAMARVTLIVNTRRMARRLRTLFDQGPPALLPRIATVTALDLLWDMSDLPPTLPPLRRKLELARLISALMDEMPDLAPRAALFDLADSLAALMDEMQAEGVGLDAIQALDITDQSDHWKRITDFLSIIRGFDARTDMIGQEARQRLIVQQLIDRWAANPPATPVILAGSTGSRGTTHLLLKAVARLPQGAVILPGYDRDMSLEAWQALDTAQGSEDHPQYRFRAVQNALDIDPRDILRWTETPPPNPARNALWSLALHPAPVTDRWLVDGPELDDIPGATEHVTLLEAPSLRFEALTIAMRLRQAARDGASAALISPDRILTRQVAAALDRWRIRPDDSAGMPLHLSPPGRFLRHVAGLLTERLSTEMLLMILKHPLTHAAAGRGPHRRLSSELELYLRKKGLPFPDAAILTDWAARSGDPMTADWLNWVTTCFLDQHVGDALPLDELSARHRRLAEAIARGGLDTGDPMPLWDGEAGEAARLALDTLSQEAPHGGSAPAHDFAALLHNLLSAGEVRATSGTHPNIRILGTLEARVQMADLVILAGLNEGTWPETPGHDPWLNRALRQQAGLLLPERRIGLAAHDFQQAALAPEVWLTRSIRSDEAETVAARWLNRLTNLLGGLPEQGGEAALRAIRQRGTDWLARATALEATTATTPEPRPAPAPPVHTRPRTLSVTNIERLIRDPYAVYARHILRLYPLNPVQRTPDALMRGTVLHKVAEHFIRDTRDDDSAVTAASLLATADAVLADVVPWAQTRLHWRARLERIAQKFVSDELGRRVMATPTAFETRGAREMPERDFTLTAKADRIDLDNAGRPWIFDYKTGAPPSVPQQMHFEKQLLLTATIAEAGGFDCAAPGPVAGAEYLSLGSKGEIRAAPLDTQAPVMVWGDLAKLIAAYQSPAKGYLAMRAPKDMRYRGDYEHLARFGEWDRSDPGRTTPLEAPDG